MAMSSERWRVVRFAVLFAVVATGIWGLIEAGVSFSFLGVSFWDVHTTLSFGGIALGWQLQALAGVGADPGAGWAWLVSIQLVASLMMGLAYGWLGSIVRRAWPKSRLRAVTYPTAVVLITGGSYLAGVSHFYSAYPGAIESVSQFDVGVFTGNEWAAIAFAIAVPALAVLEALITRMPRTEQSPQPSR